MGQPSVSAMVWHAPINGSHTRNTPDSRACSRAPGAAMQAYSLLSVGGAEKDLPPPPFPLSFLLPKNGFRQPTLTETSKAYS